MSASIPDIDVLISSGQTMNSIANATMDASPPVQPTPQQFGQIDTALSQAASAVSNMQTAFAQGPGGGPSP